MNAYISYFSLLVGALSDGGLGCSLLLDGGMSFGTSKFGSLELIGVLLGNLDLSSPTPPCS